MALFSIPTRAGKSADIDLAKKSNAKLKQTPTKSKSSGGLLDKINTIRAVVEKNLGYLKDDYKILNTEEEFVKYIDTCILNGVVAIDTETTGLDPLQNDIVGMSLYTPNLPAVYVPIHHKSYITQMYVEEQLSVEFIRKQLERISDVKIIMFNACFDIRFIWNCIGIKLNCYWDGYLAARLLNDNEGKGNNGLKKLYNKYVLDGKGDAFKFDDLFSGITFDYIPVSTGYIYAAHDAKMTYELYDFQRPFLTPDDEICINKGLKDVAWVFHNIEMPCISVVADMENTGIEFDFDYNEELKEKYHQMVEEKVNIFLDVCNEHKDQIDIYRLQHPDCKLDDPINIKSSSQLCTLFYDILKYPVPIDKRSKQPKRSSNEDALLALDNEISKAVLSYRELSTIVDTFIDKLPECVNPKDGRIHCKFNQYGADTGRFSSSDPNLQNIPSHNKDIRKMFKATDGYVLMSSDYSQQEPKMMAQLCGDKKMLQAYTEGKDLYAEIAALSFNTTYDNCLEFRPDGTTNPEGKERRSQAKSILLGVLYGRGVPSIAEQLGTTVEQAQRVKDSVFKGFPAIPKFEQDSLEMAEEYGFVTTLWGRKRRFPAFLKPDYEYEWINGVAPDDDPLGFDDDEELETEVPEKLCRKYNSKLRYAKFGQKRSIFEQANAEGIYVIDNTIDKQPTKIVNARIQGSAADMSKLAIIKVGTDERLKELGFRLLIPIHDELIGECPEENAKECAERFAYLMSIAASDKLTIPISCDVEITKQWYGDSVEI